MSSTEAEKPHIQGELALQTLAMPKDTNANGDIFGGWLVSQMDLAAGIISKQVTKGRIRYRGYRKRLISEASERGFNSELLWQSDPAWADIRAYCGGCLDLAHAHRYRRCQSGGGSIRLCSHR